MRVKISNFKSRPSYPESLEAFLPQRLREEISALSFGGRIEEIRLRREQSVTLTTDRGNIFLRTALRREEINDILSDMCGHSIYAHSETINKGYITLKGGIRVGICGRAAVESGSVIGVYDVSALNIRIPSYVRSVGEPVCSLLRSMPASKGVLIYSPPGVGKTTLLRSVAYKMASGERARRVAVIDTRGELCGFEELKGVAIDMLSGYPKPLGIEIAARTMNAELMVCDEIGGEDEADAIISAQNCGVPLLASAHGDDLAGLLRRPQILKLHKAGVFGAYVRIVRAPSAIDYRYEIRRAEEADAVLQNSGSARIGS